MLQQGPRRTRTSGTGLGELGAPSRSPAHAGCFASSSQGLGQAQHPRVPGQPQWSPPCCPRRSQWGGNTNAGGEIPADGLGRGAGERGGCWRSWHGATAPTSTTPQPGQRQRPRDTLHGTPVPPAGPSPSTWGELGRGPDTGDPQAGQGWGALGHPPAAAGCHGQVQALIPSPWAGTPRSPAARCPRPSPPPWVGGGHPDTAPLAPLGCWSPVTPAGQLRCWNGPTAAVVASVPGRWLPSPRAAGRGAPAWRGGSRRAEPGSLHRPRLRLPRGSCAWSTAPCTLLAPLRQPSRAQHHGANDGQAPGMELGQGCAGEMALEVQGKGWRGASRRACRGLGDRGSCRLLDLSLTPGPAGIRLPTAGGKLLEEGGKRSRCVRRGEAGPWGGAGKTWGVGGGL